jgi:hypothetical protein
MLNHTHVASRPPTDQASIAAILAADRADIFQETTRVQALRRDAPVICANCGQGSAPHAWPALLLGSMPRARPWTLSKGFFGPRYPRAHDAHQKGTHIQ